METFTKLARGIRNNNPGNIRHGQNFLGNTCDHLPADQRPDKSFCTFSSMAYGIRALIRILITYTTKRNCKTVRQIISRWAPPSENDTESYIRSVSRAIGKPSDEVLDFSDTSLYIKIAKAIAKHENGQSANMIDENDWIEGIKLAGL